MKAKPKIHIQQQNSIVCCIEHLEKLVTKTKNSSKVKTGQYTLNTRRRKTNTQKIDERLIEPITPLYKDWEIPREYQRFEACRYVDFANL